VGEKPMAFFIINLRGSNPDILGYGINSTARYCCTILAISGFIEEMNI
jgi:hypothetical protein